MLNQLKTILLLGVMSVLLIGISSFFGEMGLFIGLIFALVMNFGSFFFGHKIILRMYKAKEASPKDYPQLHSMVKELSRRAKIPVPKIYIIPSSSPNAFATGRDPKHGIVACTQGIMDLLKPDELKGVIAHEIAHIKNRDILIATIAATIASVISYLANMAQWAAIFGGFRGDDNDSNPAGMIALAILTPIIATLLQLGISRTREYIADATAAKLTKQPHSLAHALEKISAGVAHRPMRGGNEATASLFIANPFSKKGFTALFSTHPPTHERIKKLKSMRV